MSRGTPLPLPYRGLRTGILALALLWAPGAWAQGPDLPHHLPPVSSIPLRPDSFDVRAFDPLGMPEQKDPTIAAAPTEKDAPPAPASQQSGRQGANLAALGEGGKAAPRSAGTGLFSDGWSRDGFGSQR